MPDWHSEAETLRRDSRTGGDRCDFSSGSIPRSGSDSRPEIDRRFSTLHFVLKFRYNPFYVQTAHPQFCRTGQSQMKCVWPALLHSAPLLADMHPWWHEARTRAFPECPHAAARPLLQQHAVLRFEAFHLSTGIFQAISEHWWCVNGSCG